MHYVETKDIEISEIRKPKWPGRTATLVDPHFIASVKEHQIEPIIVRMIGDNDQKLYELVCGGRRLRATEESRLTKIRAEVLEMSDHEAWKMMNQENAQRENVNPMDTAASIVFAMKEFGWSQEKAGRELDLERFVVSNLLRVYRQPLLEEKVRNEEHTVQSALELLAYMPDKEKFLEKYAEWKCFVNKTKGLSAGKIRKEALARRSASIARVRNCGGCGQEIEIGDHLKSIEMCAECAKIFTQRSSSIKTHPKSPSRNIAKRAFDPNIEEKFGKRRRTVAQKSLGVSG